MSQPPPPHRSSDSAAVTLILAWDGPEEQRARCLESALEQPGHTLAALAVEGSTAALAQALALAPGDSVVLLEPVLFEAGWLARLRQAALWDSNVATVSATGTRGGEPDANAERTSDAGERATDGSPEHPTPAGAHGGSGTADPGQPGEPAGEGTPPEPFQAGEHRGTPPRSSHAGRDGAEEPPRPRLTRALGPCIYLRREALELLGGPDALLAPAEAVELDLPERCLQAGLMHLAAPEVRLHRLAPAAPADPGALAARYPYLAHTPPGASEVLAWTRAASRPAEERPSVTIDARALQGLITGTQVHILELILALAATGRLRLRLLLWRERIDEQTLALLRSLAAVELLDVEEALSGAPASEVFHRPQQMFSHGDLALAAALGERVVLSQLDLIAYDNPAYFADGAAWEQYRAAGRLGLALADRVVVFSEHTRRLLIADALAEPGRIEVLAPGLDHRAGPGPERPAALTGEGPFLLCLGTDFHHKNRPFAIRVAAALQARHGFAGRLVFAGTHVEHGSSAPQEAELLAATPSLASAFLDLGPVGEAEKAWLMTHAEAVLYPSTYEGFGLVPFEAALAGVPCLFAPWSSLAEVAPPGAPTIEPWDAEASADALHTLLEDPSARERHVSELARAARALTWESTAARMVEIYCAAAHAPPRPAARAARDAAAREATLTARHGTDVERLIGERELVLRAYDEQIEALGAARALIGPSGALPEDLQRMLLALSGRPGLARPLFGALARAFALLRRLARLTGAGARR